MNSRVSRYLVFAFLLSLVTGLAQATTIGTVSGSTVTLTAGTADGVRVGMTALVHGVVTIEGRATDVEFAKIEVTAVEERSCTATILRVLPTANALQVAEGQRVVFQQTLVPPSVKPAGEPTPSDTPRPPTPSRDPYSKLSPLELSAKADAAYSAGQYDEAEKLYTAVLRAVPDDPGASSRLKELGGRRQQAEKLKNADFFLSRGDEAYKTGDFAMAATYYTKVAEVDESYKDAGAKYWLSKALAAKGAGDTTGLREATGKLKALALPESLKGDFASLGPVEEEVKAPDNSTLVVTFEARSNIDKFQLVMDGTTLWVTSLSTWVGKKNSVSNSFSVAPGNHDILLWIYTLGATVPIEARFSVSTPGGTRDMLRVSLPFLGNLKVELNGKAL